MNVTKNVSNTERFGSQQGSPTTQIPLIPLLPAQPRFIAFKFSPCQLSVSLALALRLIIWVFLTIRYVSTPISADPRF